MKAVLAAAAVLALGAPQVMAQSVQEKSALEAQCSRQPGSAACEQLRRELPPTTTGTVPGPSTSNRPGSGATGSSDGVSGAGAGSVTRQGNPASAGGSPQSSQ